MNTLDRARAQWRRRWPHALMAVVLVITGISALPNHTRGEAVLAASPLEQLAKPVRTAGAAALAVPKKSALKRDSTRARTTKRASSIWLPYWDMDDAVRTVSRNRDLFHTASMFWFDASCERITWHPGAGNRDVMRRLRGAGIDVMATVTGTGLGPGEAIDCFANPKRRSRHINRLIGLLKSRSYTGLDLDYEDLALTGRPRQADRVRRAYTAFVRELCPRVQRLGKDCVITVMSRTADQPRMVQGRLLTSVFDYTAISRAASRMRVMTYDQHTRRDGPGPVAGLPWVKKVIAYIKAHTDASKVELGVPLYGRNWGTRSFDTLIGQEAFRLARRHRKTPRYDAKQREYTFAYRARGEGHRVWFSGPRSEAERVRLALDSGLAGAAFWAAGQQQNGSWAAVRNR